MLHADRRRAESFGTQAERYDRTRPTYPEALLDEILGAVPTPLSVLDVGCGTGIAARLMAARGASVLGVEVDPRMAALATAQGTAVEIGAFESWPDGGRRFDRVTAAQAWHWVDPVAGATKAAAVLRPGGRVCAFWNVGHQPPDLAAALAEVYRKAAPGNPTIAPRQTTSASYGSDPTTGYGAASVEGLRACAGLEEPVVDRFSWNRRYSRDAWLDQLPTHSDHATMAPGDLARVLEGVAEVIDRFGGGFEMGYTTLLISAARR